jgi:hypothetical protein
MEPPQLGPVEPGCLPERIEPRAPQRLVDIDVPHPRERALVEERRLERGAAARETLAEPRGREERVERLVPQPCGEIRLRLPGLEQKPGAEAPHVAVRDIRSVV